MVEQMRVLWDAPPTPLGLTLVPLVALATAGWAATWNARSGMFFALLNVGIAAFIVAGLVGWLAAGR